MSRIQNYPLSSMNALFDKIHDELSKYKYLEEAAQKCVDTMYREFEESIVLIRLYATVPFKQLPASNQEFVIKFGNSKGITPFIKDDTRVLSLLGTRGVKAAWNDRHKSQGHLGIPLVTASFVESIPMIAWLLKEMGVGLDWIDNQDAWVVGKTLRTGLASMFYVPDAKTAVDYMGRKIIPAQDFVTTYGIKTVFGMGGSYINGTFITIILFTREVIEKSKTEKFMPLASTFKSATMSIALEGKIFAGL